MQNFYLSRFICESVYIASNIINNGAKLLPLIENDLFVSLYS